MSVEDDFISVSGLICEPSRAKMLWNLLDGRAYTASELALVADLSSTSASNHLSKLLAADIITVNIQGRHRYYSFSRPEIAYVIESLASIVDHRHLGDKKPNPKKGIRFCRTCYDHMAGYVGVTITEALETKEYIEKSASEYSVTEKGWKWASEIGILKDDFGNKRRPILRQCFDWSERKPHIAGQFGAKLLSIMLNEKWFKKDRYSRMLILTLKGREKLNAVLGIRF